MTTPLGTPDRPVRIAIVGAGPAGFYAAEALLKNKAVTSMIDIFNHQPNPFGLVRDGVAPDHQSIKGVTRIYDGILANERVRYFGNVTLGTELYHADLKANYDQIIYAVGAQSDRRMGITGEDLVGSYPATAFVAWYNGHIDYSDRVFDLSHPRAVVIGNGNVAMDVTRILVRAVSELATTDMADHALAAFRTSGVREVIVLGRRGPAQAAFTNAEIKEFGELPGVEVIIDADDLQLDPLSEASLAANKIAVKNMDTMRGFAARERTHAERRIVLRFFASPVEILGADGRVVGVKVERNALIADGRGGLKAQGTGEYDVIECGLVLRSVGYRSIPLEGVPFDEKAALIPNVAGRVTAGAGGVVIAGEYVVGWAKRGPSGVIGTNKPDSVATVASMVEDLAMLPDAGAPDAQVVVDLLAARGARPVSYSDWKRIDAVEQLRGGAQGRPRVKIISLAEMLAIVNS